MKNIICLVFCVLLVVSCKKPKLGRYVLKSGNNTIVAYGDEIKVTTQHITYGGAFSDIRGVLERHCKKVTGELILYPDYNIRETITINGTIEHDGSLIKYKIVGTSTDKYGNSGKFTLTQIPN